MRAKLELAQDLDPAEVDRARASVRAWRGLRPDVDLYVAPVLGVELPPVDCDELDIRIPATAFLRPFNVLGWAAIAIGDLQLIAPSDEVVLGAALAWERAAYGLTSAMSSAAGRVTSTFEPKPAYEVSMMIRDPCGGAVGDADTPDAPPVVEPERRGERLRRVVVA